MTALAYGANTIPSNSFRAVSTTAAVALGPLPETRIVAAPVGCSMSRTFGSPEGIFAIAAAGDPSIMQADATLTAPSTPIEAWQRCGMNVRVEMAPPAVGGLTRVIFGTDLSLTSPRTRTITPATSGRTAKWRSVWIGVANA